MTPKTPPGPANQCIMPAKIAIVRVERVDAHCAIARNLDDGFCCDDIELLPCGSDSMAGFSRSTSITPIGSLLCGCTSTSKSSLPATAAPMGALSVRNESLCCCCSCVTRFGTGGISQYASDLLHMRDECRIRPEKS
jgi:hypothetical protein